jgi:hypothetical protein
MEQAFADYLKTLHIPVSRKYFRKRVASHPDYPSLLSISDIFENLGIPHGAARMDRKGLENLEFPYVLHLEKGAGTFMLIKEESDPVEQTEKLLHDWFELADLTLFRKKYPFRTNGESKSIDAMAARYSGWFEKAGIKGTPTFFVNGYKLTGQYQVKDLRYLVLGLSEQILAAPIKWGLDKEKAKYE